ncbi:MAG: efflux RND transporter permease subunit [Flavobacteriaceae bacterium]|jgi:HAE1 family hydrophobic/amphiphilic exporter-1|nr:efflux RND transporter permease subunit [Flavobacteriaceae bacterium]
MNLPGISIKRPTLVVVLFTILILGGMLSYPLLSYELIPKFEVNILTISTAYPGASPTEVENTVTKKIENAVSSIENIQSILSRSYENVSVVTISLNDGTDVNYALNDAQRKVNSVVAKLPKDALTPSLTKFSLDDKPVMTVAATADMSETDFYDLITKKIQPELSRIPGVAQINIVGGQEREIQVNINQSKLEGYGLSLPGVQQIILASNLDFPTGEIKTRKNTMLIRLSGKYKNVEELRNMVILTQYGVQIRLGDIADVQDTSKDIEKISRFNQKSAVLLQIAKQTDANAVKVSKLAKQKLINLQDDYKSNNVKLVVASDSSDFTLETAKHVMYDLMLAIILVAIVMLLFLHNIQNAFIVMISIPCSLIATLIGLYLLGYTLNLLTLVALSLVVGILVDDAIVVMENIHRHMEMGKNKVRASYDGTNEIIITVMSITLVIIFVFLPIAVTNQLVTNILKQFCVTVMIATGFSLLTSFTIVPWLSSRFGKLKRMDSRNAFGRFIIWFEEMQNRFAHWISGLLSWSLKNKMNKIITMSIATALFIGSILLIVFGFIGAEFFPQVDRGEFIIQIELPKDASLEQTNFALQKAENFLAKKSEVVNMIITTVGQVSGKLSVQSTSYKGEIIVKLNDKRERIDNPTIYAAKVKHEMEKLLVGAKITTATTSLVGTVDNAPLQLVVTAPEMQSAMAFAKRAETELKKIDGATQIYLSVEEGMPEINVQVDRDKMSLLGLNLSMVGETMRTAFNGNTDAKFRLGDNEYDINVRYDAYNRSNIDDVRNIVFSNNTGQQIKLSQFAAVTEETGTTQLDRYNRSPSVTISAQVIGRAVGNVASDWKAKFSQLKRPAGVSYEWIGDMTRQNEGFGVLGITLLAAIILVYLIMVGLYDNYVHPFVVLFSIPLSLIGVFITLALTRISLNIFTLLGIVVLIGLVCKNAILLIDFTNNRKNAGETTYKALIQANHARLRPILMTTISMVFGMLPLAFSNGPAAEAIKGLAWVVIGGLISSLFLTLVIVPVVYSIMDGLIYRTLKRKKKTDYEAEMHADYTPMELDDDGFSTKHN